MIECIVVDGGSVDSTRDRARMLGALVIETHKGRGQQIRAGIARSRGDVVLILHGDCVLLKGIPAQILRGLNGKVRSIGGAVGMAYAESSPRYRAIAWLNNARARWAGISFGDQAQFFRKEALPRIGGFPDLMLMEDVELALKPPCSPQRRLDIVRA